MASYDSIFDTIPRYALVDYLHRNSVAIPQNEENIKQSAWELFEKNFPIQGVVNFVINDVIVTMEIKGNIVNSPVPIMKYLVEKYVNDTANNTIHSDEILFVLQLIEDSDNFLKKSYPNQTAFYDMYDDYIRQIVDAIYQPDLFELTPEGIDCIDNILEYLQQARNEGTTTLAQYAWSILYLLDILDYVRNGTVMTNFDNLHGYNEIRNCADGSESIKEFLETYRNDIVVPIISDVYSPNMISNLFFNGRALMLFPTDIYTNLEETIYIGPIDSVRFLYKSIDYIILKILYDYYVFGDQDNELDKLDEFLSTHDTNLDNYKPYDSKDANNAVLEAAEKLGLKYNDLGVEYRKRKAEEDARRYNRSRRRDNASSSSISNTSDRDSCNDILCPKNIRTKKDYRRWALKNHPDKGGDTSTFQNVQDCINKERYCDKY